MLNNKEITARLALGPMSTEAIEAVYRYSDDYDVQLMLIASKAQIDYDGGYVNNWNTAQYVEHIKNMVNDFGYANANVLLCRDHCGPGFKLTENLSDANRTIDADIEAGFDLIHVDSCHVCGDHKSKLEYSRQLIEYIQNHDKDMMFEIGTDENIGAAEMNLDRIEKDINFFLSFCDPKFYVVQTGSLIKEINQVGSYNESVVESISELLHSRDLKLKEHNADYLSYNDLKYRRKTVDAMP